MSSKISNINRLLRVYRDLHTLINSVGCPVDVRKKLNVSYTVVSDLLLILLSQSGSSIRCDK